MRNSISELLQAVLANLALLPENSEIIEEEVATELSPEVMNYERMTAWQRWWMDADSKSAYESKHKADVTQYLKRLNHCCLEEQVWILQQQLRSHKSQWSIFKWWQSDLLIDKRYQQYQRVYIAKVLELMAKQINPDSARIAPSQATEVRSRPRVVSNLKRKENVRGISYSTPYLRQEVITHIQNYLGINTFWNRLWGAKAAPAVTASPVPIHSENFFKRVITHAYNALINPSFNGTVIPEELKANVAADISAPPVAIPVVDAAIASDLLVRAPEVAVVPPATSPVTETALVVSRAIDKERRATPVASASSPTRKPSISVTADTPAIAGAGVRPAMAVEATSASEEKARLRAKLSANLVRAVAEYKELKDRKILSQGLFESIPMLLMHLFDLSPEELAKPEMNKLVEDKIEAYWKTLMLLLHSDKRTRTSDDADTLIREDIIKELTGLRVEQIKNICRDFLTGTSGYAKYKDEAEAGAFQERFKAAGGDSIEHDDSSDEEIAREREKRSQELREFFKGIHESIAQSLESIKKSEEGLEESRRIIEAGITKQLETLLRIEQKLNATLQKTDSVLARAEAAILILLPRYLAANPGISSEEALARIHAETSARLAASAIPSALTFGNALSAAVSGAESSAFVV